MQTQTYLPHVTPTIVFTPWLYCSHLLRTLFFTMHNLFGCKENLKVTLSLFNQKLWKNRMQIAGKSSSSLYQQSQLRWLRNFLILFWSTTHRKQIFPTCLYSIWLVWQQPTSPFFGCLLIYESGDGNIIFLGSHTDSLIIFTGSPVKCNCAGLLDFSFKFHCCDFP